MNPLSIIGQLAPVMAMTRRRLSAEDRAAERARTIYAYLLKRAENLFLQNIMEGTGMGAEGVREALKQLKRENKA